MVGDPDEVRFPKDMGRRTFGCRALGLAAIGGLASALADPALAQGGPIEGKHFLRLAQPVPTSVDPGKIEVIEFFWYGCPHCYAFEPTLGTWITELPADVSFRRVPVAFRAEPFVAHQRIFYALESLGLVGEMHRKVFYAIHNDRMRLDKPDEILAFVTKNGGDAEKFKEAWASFGTQAKLRQANQLVQAYKVDGVPAMGIHGRFFTSATLAGDHTRALAATDALIQRIRTKTI